MLQWFTRHHADCGPTFKLHLNQISPLALAPRLALFGQPTAHPRHLCRNGAVVHLLVMRAELNDGFHLQFFRQRVEEAVERLSPELILRAHMLRASILPVMAEIIVPFPNRRCLRPYGPVPKYSDCSGHHGSAPAHRLLAGKSQAARTGPGAPLPWCPGSTR
jgi:hypothetical protein